MPTGTKSEAPLSNPLIVRRDDIAERLDRTEDAFKELKRTFDQPPHREGLEREMRLAISHVEVCLEHTYLALTEEFLGTPLTTAQRGL